MADDSLGTVRPPWRVVAQIQPARQSVQVWAQSQRAHQSAAQLGALKAAMSKVWFVMFTPGWGAPTDKALARRHWNL